jgi:hypothetical protein
MQHLDSLCRGEDVAHEAPARIQYTEADKALMWERWRQGESLPAIARLFDRYHPSIRRDSLKEWRDSAAAPKSLPLALALAEREEISRAATAGLSVRAITVRGHLAFRVAHATQSGVYSVLAHRSFAADQARGRRAAICRFRVQFAKDFDRLAGQRNDVPLTLKRLIFCGLFERRWTSVADIRRQKLVK